MSPLAIAALLGVGILTGWLIPGKLTNVFGTATLYIFLPALLFEGAWRLDVRSVRRVWRPIVLLAVPGVIVTAVLIAACVHFGGGLAWGTSLLLGTILSATDPVAVLAIFRRLGLPRPLVTIVEAEALLNDAVAVVLYRAVLVATLSLSMAVGLVALQSLAVTVLGVGCGAAVALICAMAMRWRPSVATYVAMTLAGSYGSYYLANRFDLSGIFAVLAFAVVLGRQHRIIAVQRFWDAVAFGANAVLFFLVGAALDFSRFGPAIPIALLTLASVIAARFAVAYGLLQLARPPLYLSWLSIVRLAGVRGALSLALALAVPVTLSSRNLIIDSTFVVVVVTIFSAVAGLGRSRNVFMDHVENNFSR